MKNASACAVPVATAIGSLQKGDRFHLAQYSTTASMLTFSVDAVFNGVKGMRGVHDIVRCKIEQNPSSVQYFSGDTPVIVLN